MSSALDRVNAAYAASVSRRPAAAATRVGSKSWAGEPPFWALDSMRLPFMSSLPDRERIEHDFDGYVRGAGKADGIVFACFYARLRHYAQAEFRWEDLSTGDLRGETRDLRVSGSRDLRLLERPWPTGTTADLLAWMEVDATFAGNSFWTWTDNAGRYGAQASGPGLRLTRMRPDWVWIVIGSQSGDPYALDARPVLFIYEPRTAGNVAAGLGTKQPAVLLTPAEVCHYAPVPDPEARFRGMSWLTPVLREISADRAATEHKLAFFERGATLQTIVALDKDVPVAAFDEFVERFKASHEGTDNAYGTLFVGGGADVTVTSADLQKLDYHKVQGGGETRIAADAGVHPVVVGLSEGLSGSSLNAGNYRSAMRSFADGTLTHLWKTTCSSLSNLVNPPSGTRLWIDKAALAFLHEDAKDLAEIQQKQAIALRALLDSGYTPDAAVAFLRSNDLGKLIGQHSGLFSVQLQPPGSQQLDPAAAINGANGSAPDDMKHLLPALPWRP